MLVASGSAAVLVGAAVWCTAGVAVGAAVRVVGIAGVAAAAMAVGVAAMLARAAMAGLAAVAMLVGVAVAMLARAATAGPAVAAMTVRVVGVVVAVAAVAVSSAAQGRMRSAVRNLYRSFRRSARVCHNLGNLSFRFLAPFVCIFFLSNNRCNYYGGCSQYEDRHYY